MAECNLDNSMAQEMGYANDLSQPSQSESEFPHDTLDQSAVHSADGLQFVSESEAKKTEIECVPHTTKDVDAADTIDVEQTPDGKENARIDIESAPTSITDSNVEGNVGLEQTTCEQENTKLDIESAPTSITDSNVEDNVGLEQTPCEQENTKLESECTITDATVEGNIGLEQTSCKQENTDIEIKKNHQTSNLASKTLCDICKSKGKDAHAVCLCLGCAETVWFCEQCSQNHTTMDHNRNHQLSFDINTASCTEQGRDLQTVGQAKELGAECSNTSDVLPDDVENTEPVCEPCCFKGVTSTPVNYCMNCDEKYCERCSKQHRAHKGTRDHHVVYISNMLTPHKEICEPCAYNEEDREATNVCTDCDERLCDECSNHHRSQKQYRLHQIKPLSKQAMCESCNERGQTIPATSFCLDCKDPDMLCQSCAKQHLSFKRSRDHRLSKNMFEYALRRLRRSKETAAVEIKDEADHADEKSDQKPTDHCPGQPYGIDTAMSNYLTIRWPDTTLKDNDAYQVSFKEGINGKWRAYTCKTKLSMLRMEGLKPETSYVFKVRVVNDVSGQESPYSIESEEILTGESPALGMMKASKQVYRDPIPVYALPLKEIRPCRDAIVKTRKLYLGQRSRQNVSEKNIMVVGATGSGKSTLLNAMANYIMGVTWEDPFRFTLIDVEQSEKAHDGDQAYSQTEWITCYSINNTVSSKLNYTVNLIDTPGFGDTRGLDKDKLIVEQIRALFSAKGKKGVATIDAVCFILKAPDARLSAPQIYIFEAILSLFGNDVKDNICTLITFADGQRPPVLAALEALEHKSLPYEKYFTFNNSALYVSNTTADSGNFSPDFWEMGMKSCKSFFDHLGNLSTKSLLLTSEVLAQRESLENTIQYLYDEIDIGLSKIGVLEQEIDIFIKYKRQIRENKNFAYQVTEHVQEKIDISGERQYTTNCLQCNFTCHEKCKYANDDDKVKCWAMNKDGTCRICPEGCHWTQHHNSPFIIKWVPKKIWKKYSEKQKIYQEATTKSLTQEQMLDKMSMDIGKLEDAITDKMQEIAKYNNRLKEIALRPDPLSTVEYINMIIDGEKREKKSGFQSRINAFEMVKQKAEYGNNVKVFKERVRSTKQTLHSTVNDNEHDEESGAGFLDTVKKYGKKMIHAIKI